MVRLKKHRGRAHCSVRDEANPALILDGDAPLDSPHKNDLASRKLHLDSQQLNLKARRDEDYKTYRRKKALDPNHFDTVMRRLKECISAIKIYYKCTPDPEAFLAELNASITAGSIYNPFGLQQIYRSENGYQMELAQDSDVFQSHIEKNSIAPPPAAAASPKRKSPTVMRGLYDGIFDIDSDSIDSPSSPTPPRKRRELFTLFASGNAPSSSTVAKPASAAISLVEEDHEPTELADLSPQPYCP